MPRFRIRASDGKEEKVWEEVFADEARLREMLPKRGWINLIGVEPVAEKAAPSHADESPALAPPPPIRAEQIREEGEWVYLPAEIAAKHPLYGIGGWAALLFALMAIGTLLGAIGFVVLLVVGGVARDEFWLYLLAVAGLAWQGFVTYLMLKERPSFPVNFLVLYSVALALGVVEIVLKGFAIAGLLYLAPTVAWMIYVTLSRRINVTYRKRVSRDDMWLQEGLKRGGAPAPAPA